MTIEVTLPYNFQPREYQEPFFDFMYEGGKRAVLVWNRRAGKDTCAWNFLIQEAVITRGIYYYIFPEATQGRKVIWDGMTNSGRKFMDFIPKQLIRGTNANEMKITLQNDSIIQIIGSDRYDALMGTNPTGCIFSEFSLQEPNAWLFIRPILDANSGWAIFVFTPRGANHAKKLYDDAKQNPEWFAQLLTNNDTHILTDEQIEKLRTKEKVPEEIIQQEWFCSFTLGIQGNFYAKYMKDARDEKRISTVPYDKSVRVNTAWDLGRNDMTSIVFYQLVGKEIHVIDFYENHHEELSHYVRELKNKPYIYNAHYMPSDALSEHLASSFSVAGRARSLGIEPTILPTVTKSVLEGIECCRRLWPRVWIDANKCTDLVVALENYRSEYDDTRNIFKNRPVHDAYSHAADAFRYMCLAIDIHHDRHNDGPSDDWVDRMQDKHNPRFD